MEEVLRFLGAVSVAPRIARQPVAIGDFEVPAGTIVSLSTASANHDPAAYAAPEVFDISVDREPQLTFGAGIFVGSTWLGPA